MKVIEFIKKNISVFNILGILLILLFLNIYFFYEKIGNEQDIIITYSFVFIPLSIFIFLIDVLFKTLFKSRIIINVIQLFILVSILIYLENII